MSQVSIQDIKRSLPSKKKKRDKMDVWVYFIIRPISYLFTWLCLKLKISAAGATYISMIIGVFGPLLLLDSNYYTRIVGAFIINFWIIFDCVDGNIARFKKSTSSFGTFIDGVSGYIIMSILYLSIGTSVYLYADTILFEERMWLYIFVGALGSIFTVFPRLIEHKASNMFPNYKSKITDKETYGLFYTIGLNIGGIAGLGLPLLLLAYIFRFENIYILFYGLFHFIIAIYTSYNTVNHLRKQKT